MQAGKLAPVLALAVAACASTPGTPSSRVPLQGQDCLDPARARSWDDVSSSEIHVDAGRRRYRIRVPPACLPIGLGTTLIFDGDPISGRVCGVIGDALVLAGGVRCPIDRIELIDATGSPANAGD